MFYKITDILAFLDQIDMDNVYFIHPYLKLNDY